MLRDYLAMEGINIPNPTAWKYANELGLSSVVRRKRYDYLDGKKDHIFPNLVNREFTVSESNKIWCTGVTKALDYVIILLAWMDTMNNIIKADLDVNFIAPSNYAM